MAQFNPEEILNLQDQEIVQKVETEDGFAEYLTQLMLEIYQDDTLAQVRIALMEEATNTKGVDLDNRLESLQRIENADNPRDFVLIADLSVPSEKEQTQHRETEYSLAYAPQQTTDLRVQVLAKVRAAVKRIYPDSKGLYTQSKEHDATKDILKRTHDGDLSYFYSEEDRDGMARIAGEYANKVFFEWGMNYSPEFQLAAVKKYRVLHGEDDRDARIVQFLAQEGKLTEDAWEALLNRADDESFRAVWNTTDARPEIMDLILANEKHSLIFKARTEQSAREEIKTRPEDFGEWAESIDHFFECRDIEI